MITIGIIGAMKEEIKPLLDFYKNYNKIIYANREFYEVNLDDKKLFIVESKIGKVNSAITSTILIERFNCNYILFSGVAGGISKDLGLGSLLFANKLCQHDFDITSFNHPYGHIPNLGVYIEADLNLIEIAKKVAKNKSIDLKSGIIASGDQFIANIDKKNWIETTFLADAIEMEGASVAQVCKTFEIPFFILRSISDTADGKAPSSFEEFLKTSAKNSAEFIIQMEKEIKLS